MRLFTKIKKWCFKTDLSNPKLITKEKTDLKNHFTDEEINLIASNILKLYPIITLQIKDHNFEGDENGLILRQQNPIINGQPLYEFDEYGYPEIEDNDFNYEKIILDIFSKRKINYNQAFKNLTDKGRVLGFSTLQSMPDGAPITESVGLVDNFDIPPIDTWILYINRILTVHTMNHHTPTLVKYYFVGFLIKR